MINLKEAHLKLSRKRDDIYIIDCYGEIVFCIGGDDSSKICLHEDDIDKMFEWKEQADYLSDRKSIQFLLTMTRDETFINDPSELELCRDLVGLGYLAEGDGNYENGKRRFRITESGSYIWWNIKLLYGG